jgi:hypothetical protein
MDTGQRRAGYHEGPEGQRDKSWTIVDSRGVAFRWPNDRAEILQASRDSQLRRKVTTSTGALVSLSSRTVDQIWQWTNTLSGPTLTRWIPERSGTTPQPSPGSHLPDDTKLFGSQIEVTFRGPPGPATRTSDSPTFLERTPRVGILHNCSESYRDGPTTSLSVR